MGYVDASEANGAKVYHPAVVAVLRWFAFEHLPEDLREVSRLFADMAHRLADTLPHDPELTAGLRYLLLAKDAAVRVATLSREG